MLHSICIILVVYFVVLSNGLTYRMDPVSFELVRDTVIECNNMTEGRYCQSCENIFECINLGGDIWLNEPVGSCDVGKCMNGDCTNQLNPVCDPGVTDYVPTCKQIGVFPHPFNRCKYFICSVPQGNPNSEVAIELSCPTGYMFDPATSLCSTKLVGPCPALIQPCKALSDRGPIPNNTRLYFICLSPEPGRIVPQILQCPGSTVYNATGKLCSEPSLEPPRDTGLNADGKCLKKGYFYDPSNCFTYMDCYAQNFAPIRRYCFSKMYFDDRLGRCVDFTCGNTGL